MDHNLSAHSSPSGREEERRRKRMEAMEGRVGGCEGQREEGWLLALLSSEPFLDVPSAVPQVEL